jgi:hypothetical protein
MIKLINSLKQPYPTLGTQIDALAANVQALSKVEDAIYSKTGNRIFVSTQSVLGILTRMYQYTMSFVYDCGTQNYSGANADIRCVAETVCAAYWLIQKPERMIALSSAKVSTGKILNCGYSANKRIEEIYAETSDIVHCRPDSFELYPVTLPTGEKRWTALTLGWSAHRAQEAISRMNVLHSIFSDAATRIVELDERYYMQGKVLMNRGNVSATFVCRGYVPLQSD